MFQFNEKNLSHIPALQLLANMGYQILTPGQALQARGGKYGNVLLDSVLRKQLMRLNRICFRGRDYDVSEDNIEQAIRQLKEINYSGLQKANAAIYDLITLGATVEKKLAGNSRGFNLHYIDWKTLANNIFHATPEYAVERNRSLETARPDIVLFVNGIPLAVIECKAPDIEIEQAISQQIRNQGDAYIPRLFGYVQLLIGVNKNTARYATAGTAKAFWKIWNEPGLVDNGLVIQNGEDYETLCRLKNKPLGKEAQRRIEQTLFCSLPPGDAQTPTPQDAALYCLCRPARLLDLSYRFTLFERGEKKIARYQQFFVTHAMLKRLKRRGADGKRAGGIIWHTQGSGKSLSMVMLARALLLDKDINNPRMVLVTDRDDLDRQLGNTFKACGAYSERAASGRDLVRRLKDKTGIITTLIHKFERGWSATGFVDDSADIFVLVDEGHRTNFGELAARMRQMLPNACYLGFTGTPLMRDEKNNFRTFGSLIEPHYSIRQAVKDKAVLPLLYEGRHVDMQQDKAAIDLWFERHTADLTKAQQADLKRKYARADALNKAERVIYMRAFDISEHYRKHWQGTGLKAQLVAPNKAAALSYHKHLRDIGFVSSAVIISAPDAREGHEEVDAGASDNVGKFWNKMMQRYGSEDKYNKQIIEQFKHDDEPEILIVVDKLLTGFDAPRNTVLYLCRTLREHTLLQAIARVNRLHEDKDFGYIIDHVSALGELDKALTMYDALAGFDEADVAGTLTSINDKTHALQQHYSDLWDVFCEVKTTGDEEQFETLLADDVLREEFYARLARYSKTLGIALSSDRFIRQTDERTIKNYKADLQRFHKLKAAVKLRYADAVDYRDHERKIKKLLDTHIQAHDVVQLNAPVDIFDDNDFAAVKQGQGVHADRSTAARADAIAHATKKVIREKMDEDPAFYETFSRLVQQAIDEFRARRISADDYLHKVVTLRDKVVSKQHDNVPASISENDEACAYYGMAQQYFSEQQVRVQEEAMAYMSTCIQDSLQQEHTVDFWQNHDAVNRVKSRIDEFCYDELGDKYQVILSDVQIDELNQHVMRIAKSRRRG